VRFVPRSPDYRRTLVTYQLEKDGYSNVASRMCSLDNSKASILALKYTMPCFDWFDMPNCGSNLKDSA